MFHSEKKNVTIKCHFVYVSKLFKCVNNNKLNLNK